MNLIPNEIKNTGNYFCTWDSQCDEMYARDPSAESIPSRDAMCEDFLFGKNGLLRSFENRKNVLDQLIRSPFNNMSGVRAIMESTLMDLMYRVPSDNTIREITITQDSVDGTGEPNVIHGDPPAVSHRTRIRRKSKTETA